MSASSFDDLKNALATVAAVAVTPFGADDGIDWAAHERVLQRLVAAGISVPTVNGNTGEFYALTPHEACKIVDSAVTAVPGAELLVGVGLDVESAIAAGRYAADKGVRMVMVHQPVHPYASAEGWVAYHRAIATALPELGVVPYIRDARLPGENLRRLGEECPNVVAVKYSVPDPAVFAAFAADAGGDRFVWLAGLAELSAPGYWALGARGFTSGLANVAPRLALAMLDALRRQDQAAVIDVWRLVRPFEELRADNGSAHNVSVVKEALAQLGLAGRAVRPPSHEPPSTSRERIAEILDGWRARGFLAEPGEVS